MQILIMPTSESVMSLFKRCLVYKSKEPDRDAWDILSDDLRGSFKAQGKICTASNWPAIFTTIFGAVLYLRAPGFFTYQITVSLLDPSSLGESGIASRLSRCIGSEVI